ncbi:hypothetical protein ACKKBG_A37130 [Auxenochlorella protothecoides x Auxenochlorella symbiontica]
MSPPAKTPVLLALIVLLLTRCAFAATCSSTFVSLPSAILGAHVYLTTVDSADAICKHNGFSKSGSIRTSTLNIMGLSMSAVRVSTLDIVTPRSTEILVAVECLKAGQKACTADSSGNIGSGNKGKNNFGTGNVGDDNIGNSNVGTANWGDANKGKGNRCFNKTGDQVTTATREEVTSADCQAISSTPRQEVTSATRQEGPTPARRQVAATALNPEPSSSHSPALTTFTPSIASTEPLPTNTTATSVSHSRVQCS